MNKKLLKSFSYQPDMMESMVYYVMLGLHPGSLGEKLLLQDLDGSVQKSHPLLLKKQNGKYRIIEDMIELTSIIVPDYLRLNEKFIHEWCDKGGLRYVPMALRSKVIKDLPDAPLINDSINNIIRIFYQ